MGRGKSCTGRDVRMGAERVGDEKEGWTLGDASEDIRWTIDWSRLVLLVVIIMGSVGDDRFTVVAFSVVLMMFSVLDVSLFPDLVE